MFSVYSTIEFKNLKYCVICMVFRCGKISARIFSKAPKVGNEKHGIKKFPSSDPTSRLLFAQLFVLSSKKLFSAK